VDETSIMPQSLSKGKVKTLNSSIAPLTVGCKVSLSYTYNLAWPLNDAVTASSHLKMLMATTLCAELDR